MRHLPRAILSGGLGFAVSLIAGCGGGAGLLSGNQASDLSSQLDKVSSAVADGRCTAAQDAAASFGQAVSSLPSTISNTLKTDLAAAANTINQSVPQQCHKATATKTTPPTTASTPASTTQTSTTSTSPTNTSTQTTTTPATTPSTGTTSTGSSGGGGLSGVSGAGNGGAGGLASGGGSGSAGNGNG